MTSGKRFVAMLATAGGLLCMAQDAAAESGSFTAIAVQNSSYTTLQQSGETIFAGPAEGAMVITESSGEPFAAGGHMALKCVVHGRSSATGMSLEAPCTASASTHDELYLVSKRSGESGRVELAGGTGMYEGIVGDCDYEASSVSPEVIVITATCAWQR